MFALTDNEIARRCPAIFAEDYSVNRTKKYAQYHTIDIINALRGEGFEVTNAFAQKTRNTQNPHVRHCVRMSHVDHLNETKPSAQRPEIVLVNSHNGTTSFRMMAGIFRMVCSNGLITMDENIGEEKFKHMGHTLDEVVQSTTNFAIRAAETNMELIKAMRMANLTEKQQREMAKEAAIIRLGNVPSKIENYENLLNTRRHDDNVEPTIWNTFNVLQENCIKGGQIVGNRQMREISGIDNLIRVNRNLWNLATSQLKIA